MENNNLTVATAAAGGPQKIGRIKGGYLVAIESLKILGAKKSLIFFPLLALFFELAAVGAFVVIYAHYYGFSEESLQALDEGQISNLMYGLLFIFYLLGYFIASYFQAGLTAVVSERIKGKDMSLTQGINAANGKIYKIFMWALAAATVGIILQIISRIKYAGKLVSWLIGTAWEILTFFIVSVLMLENETLGNSIKRSGTIFKDKWGQTLIANFSAGLFFGALMVLGVTVIVLIMIFG